MKTSKAIARHKKKDYQVVAVVESRRCQLHQAVLVSEAEVGPDGQITVPIYPGRKVYHCPFCRQ